MITLNEISLMTPSASHELLASMSKKHKKELKQLKHELKVQLYLLKLKQVQLLNDSDKDIKNFLRSNQLQTISDRFENLLDTIVCKMREFDQKGWDKLSEMQQEALLRFEQDLQTLSVDTIVKHVFSKVKTNQIRLYLSIKLYTVMKNQEDISQEERTILDQKRIQACRDYRYPFFQLGIIENQLLDYRAQQLALISSDKRENVEALKEKLARHLEEKWLRKAYALYEARLDTYEASYRALSDPRDPFEFPWYNKTPERQLYNARIEQLKQQITQTQISLMDIELELTTVVIHTMQQKLMNEGVIDDNSVVILSPLSVATTVQSDASPVTAFEVTSMSPQPLDPHDQGHRSQMFFSPIAQRAMMSIIDDRTGDKKLNSGVSSTI